MAQILENVVERIDPRSRLNNVGLTRQNIDEGFVRRLRFVVEPSAAGIADSSVPGLWQVTTASLDRDFGADHHIRWSEASAVEKGYRAWTSE